MFIPALFTIARTRKQLRCPLADYWIRTLWYVYPVEYYPTIKRKECESVLVRWKNLGPIIYSEISEFVSLSMGFLCASVVKNLPAIWKMQVLSLGWKDLWRRKWEPTPIFLPGKSHGQRSLVGYRPWDHKESDMT